MVTPEIPHEGEMQENMLPMGSNSQKRECEEEGEEIKIKRVTNEQKELITVILMIRMWMNLI